MTNEEHLLTKKNAELEKELAVKNRELEIEAALEKVRSRSLTMHHSNELSEVVTVVFNKLKELNFLVNQGAAIILTFTEGTKDHIEWVADPTQSYAMSFTIPYSHHTMSSDLVNAKESGAEFFSKLYSFEEKNAYFNYLFQHTNYMLLSDDTKNVMLESEHIGFSVAFKKNSAILIPTNVGKLLTDEQKEILLRFANVFEQTYIRFLDLQKAEAQAREARIEMALESVRSASLAMHYSNQLKTVATVMFKKWTELGLTLTGAFIFLFDNKTRDMQLWISTTTLSEASDISIPYTPEISNNSIFKDLWSVIENGEQIFNRVYSGKEKNDYFRHVGKYNIFPQEVKDFHQNAKSWITSITGEKHAALGFDSWDEQLATAEDFQVLKRFSKVFDQAYTRFLDLQNAEAQSRESQIQLALERVRARTMAMQHSDELADTAAILFSQFKNLGYAPDRITIGIMQEEKQLLDLWATNGEAGKPREFYQLPFSEPHVVTKCVNAWKKQSKSLVLNLNGKPLKEYTAFWKSLIATDNPVSAIEQVFFNFAFFSKGYLGFISFEYVPQQTIELLERFAGVFDLTYTRFLDLKKAEAQAREAQIEAALEKIRSRSLAMHQSGELRDVIKVMFEKLRDLNVLLGTVGIWLFDKKTMNSIFWVGNNLQEPAMVNLPYDEKLMKEDTNYKDSWQAWLTNENYINKEYSLEQKNKYFNYVFANNDFNAIPAPVRETILKAQKHTASIITEKNSSLFFDSWDGEAYSESSINVLKRTAKVFDQAYVRFLDLQKAEAQSREAQVEASLERVRSRTLAMQKSDELAETSSVLFKQLIGLGIEPHRLYISIMKDDEGETEFWITDEEGSKVSMAYEDNLNNNPSFKKMFDGWKQQKKSLVINMQGKELKDYFKHLAGLGIPFKNGLKQKRRIQYLAFFNRGFIGMAAPDEQPEATIHLLERFAAVFNLTFTRFNDLKIAEAHAMQAEQDLIEIKAARKKAEETLAELQSTQKQLVQSEKMASLGELTAGIAHEIQNPLNFVNNFSEVNKELISELVDEVDKGNTEEVKAIANDIKDNEEKISHHGKRADAIVKGMLQHSRQTSGTKEPTDINALCDEYLRLSYHGLRAKNKNFNADFKTDFDTTIGKINIVPQDIGRVLLNLFNNAFYAVKLPNPLKGSEYKPLVTVTTKKVTSHLSGADSSPSGAEGLHITVADNGNGIPSNIIDKIFQPFFTTKPTGQGTGLGLSLAYDIITKEHNGTIKVESKEGEGSVFIILLP